MYEGFTYISEHGIMRKDEYQPYDRRKNKCRISDQDLAKKNHIKDIGYVEHDGRSNEELIEILQKQPISVAIRTSGMMQSYRGGIMTEGHLRCSSTHNEVNHGVLLVGYGSVGDGSQKNKAGERVYSGHCKNYFIVRNSWGGSWGEEGFFKLCSDGLGSETTPLGTCLINKYATWPTMNKEDIEEIE
mmetsp:Transcript_3354/g.5599  ORF Transcript_3354/g.5599 Transcript_3354/m.5599 type:complete len:187 (+) Transcript_3354:833-1393(+)